jgi:uncharacterized membrane protein YdjX (TVP38/TMEM64 family)
MGLLLIPLLWYQKTMRRLPWKKLVFIALLFCIVLVIKLFDLERFLSLSYLKASRENFSAFYSEHRLPVIGAYAAAYIAATSLSIPGAAALTLMGGALFGVVTGTIVVSFASTAGATLACLVSRFLLRDWVQTRFGDKLSRINDGIAREGAFYLFTLRLIPVFPFWVINLLMGLTPMPLYTFYWVSQVGMLCGTAVYVNAGRELAHIDSASGILSPQLIFAFVLLGLFPLIARKLLVRFKAIAVARH